MNLDKINWSILSCNECNEAIELLKKNQNKIDWNNLCNNQNNKVLEILEKNQDKINWDIISCNKIIFKLDYDKIKDNFKLLGNEIIEKALDPNRIKRLSITFNFNFVDYIKCL